MQILNGPFKDSIGTVQEINKELEENEKIVEIMNYIGEKRGTVSKGNNIDLEKISKIILEDFRTGNLGKITLEVVA